MALYSPYWYRAENLRPQLKRHCALGRQVHRGQIWHVVSNRATGEYFRVTPPAYVMIGLMDGERTLADVWRSAADQLDDNLPSQEEVIQLLAQLHQADLLNAGISPDLGELAQRRDKRERDLKLAMVKNPFAIRVPLIDPDAFLTRWHPFVAPVFSLGGAAAFVALLIYAIVLAGLNWPELSNDVRSHLAATETLLLVLLVYPVIKAAHELGHGFAIKHGGSDVREMGVMFLFFMPVPYVDASAATLWPNKWRRALVSAMGAFTEIGIAAIALIVWVNAEPGWVRSLAFTVMATGGVSTLLFNGNPLLRFDGYYALADIIEIPNLGQRSINYLGYLLKRYVFGAKRAKFPTLAPGEPPWLVFYAIAAYLYRLSVAFAVAVLVSGWLFSLGLLLALWAVTQMVVWPTYKALKNVFVGEGLMTVRKRAIGTTVGSVAVILALISLVPLPYNTIVRAIVQTDDAATVVAGGSGFIAEVIVPEGGAVAAGDPVYRLENARLRALRAASIAQLKSLRASLEAGRAENPTAAQEAREQLKQAEAAVARLDTQIADLVVRAPSDGTFVAADPRLPLGRHVEQGSTLGYVISAERKNVLQIVAPESAADLIRERGRKVEIWFPHAPDRTFEGRIVRQRPQIDDKLPSPALSNLGRGPFRLDPSKPEELTSITRFVVFDAAIEGPPPENMIGATADVRIGLGWSPLLVQISRPILQVLLKLVAR